MMKGYLKFSLWMILIRLEIETGALTRYVFGVYFVGMRLITFHFDSPITPPYFIPGLVVEKYMNERDFSTR
jgi:hypothetical protein